ncbi:MAG: cation-translocating P-type ATPase [Clostridiales bacterium]|nr:cation-translocating P-type ATPase [Clostridiales bacterium]
MLYYCEEKERVLEKLRTGESGLYEKEVIERLERDGKNRLKTTKRKSLFRRFLEQLSEPMMIILILAAAVSGALAVTQKGSFANVIIIMAVVIINALLGIYQGNRAEKAAVALRKMTAANSKVIREDKVQTIHSEDLVVGDILLLETGDAVPADARILESASLKVEESVLTGEAAPISKITDVIRLKEGEKETPLCERSNIVYMGSTVVYGRGRAVVTATGMNTEMGRIADALSQTGEEQIPLQRKLKQISKVLTCLMIGICVAVFAIQIIRAGSVDADLLLDSLMIAVSLAVAAVPEGLAAVVTVVLSIGVTSMSRRNIIIRHLPAVETLGCTQVICTDKTATLTQNRMRIVDLFGEDHVRLAMGMALCSDVEIAGDGQMIGEPIEAALTNWADEMRVSGWELKKQYIRCGEAPFDSVRKMMSVVYKNQDGIIQFTKGAADMVIGRCTHYLKDGEMMEMTECDRARILSANKNMAERALRVLACAQRVWSDVPETYEPEVLEQQFCFVGLCGMIDPLRPEAKNAIEECRQAGIRPVMITGDHIDTAVTVARDLGILADGTSAVSGEQLAAMDDAVLERELPNISVYAHIQPEQKTRIVNAWKNAGYVTAMTGAGVNDAPAIQTADIGVGLEMTGTDVTNHVADVILADDSFATITDAVKEGRHIYDNLCESVQFLLGSNVSEVVSIFITSMIGATLLKPVHLLWINLITVTFPALALGTEKTEPDIMKRKPRNAKAGIFADGMVFDVLYQGIAVAALVLVSWVIGGFLENGEWTIAESAAGTVMAFLTLSAAETFHSLNMRSRRRSVFKLDSRNPALALTAVASLAATTLICEVPDIAAVFGFTGAGIAEYLIAVLLGALIIPIVEIAKLIQRHLGRKGLSQ